MNQLSSLASTNRIFDKSAIIKSAYTTHHPPYIENILIILFISFLNDVTMDIKKGSKATWFFIES